MLLKVLMILGWFDARDAKRYGQMLADMVVGGLSIKDRTTANKALIKRAKNLDKVFAQALIYKGEAKLNMYKRAKLGNAFRWHLLEQGFEHEFVEELTHQLLVHIR
jgi:nitrogenase subunit NifH